MARSMETKARIAGHPIHPMLVALPIGLYVATVAALLAYVGLEDPFYFRAALVANVAGVVMALVAAIPGAIDLFSLPKGSRARATGLKHASFALLATGLFAVAAATSYRQWAGGGVPDATVPLVLSIVGVLSLLVAGWLGWTMVQTHHVGVKPSFRAARSVPASEDYDDVVTPPPVSNGHGGDHYFPH
ncbi:MAG TPA: DUF2231 domain-containing protein [Kofleriaceae bacterium]